MAYIGAHGWNTFTVDGTGAMPLSEVKPLASSPADLEKELAMTEQLTQEYTELFK